MVTMIKANLGGPLKDRYFAGPEDGARGVGPPVMPMPIFSPLLHLDP